MAYRGGEFSFSQGIHVRIYISISITTGFDSNKTNKAGAGNVITSRLRDKLKTYLHCQSDHDHQTWQDGNLSSWETANNVTQPFNHVVL